MINIESKKKSIFYLMNKYSEAVSRIEIETLLEYLFDCTRIDLYIRDFVVDEYTEKQYDSLIGRRLNGEPVQYITGRAEFMGFDFIVNRDTFIPRPETELLAQITDYRIQSTEIKKPKILDLCTGSGNIAVSLARLIPGAEIVATDISEPALKTAEKNAIIHNVSDKIKFYRGNLFGALMFDTSAKFDIIVCNPPYIKEAEIPFLQKEVGMEPEVALDGGKDGLDFYRIIAERAHLYLKEGGSLLMEMGFGQAEDVKDIFSSYNIYETYRIINDFAGIERVMWINLL